MPGKRLPKWVRKWRRKDRKKQEAFASCAAYRERNAVIREMGYPSYAAYLRSDLWASIRSRVIAARPDCVLCQKPAENIHHVGYGRAVLGGERDEALMPLCRGCHHRVEFDGERKRTVTEAQAVFQKLHFLAKNPDHLGGLSKSEYIRQKIARKRAERAARRQ